MLEARTNSYGLLFKNRPFRVIVCLITLGAFLFSTFAQDIAWAAKGPMELTSLGSKDAGSSGSFKELNVGNFTLPEHLGHIRDSWQPGSRSPAPGPRTIIHIQDAHCNYNAQHRISEIIDYLNANYGVSTINLEGGAKDYNLSIFTDITDKTIREKVADYFVKEGMVNGSEYYAINNPDKVNLWGIEDTNLYLDNLKVYRESLKNKDEIDKGLKSLSYILNILKTKIYSKELLEFDLKYSAYKAEKLEFKDYLNYVISKAKEKMIDVKSFKNIFILTQTLDEESNIDFRKANRERDALMDAVQKKLSRNALAELVAKAVEFKQERISQKDFYAYLADKAKSRDVDLANYPELQKYILYVSMYEAIDKTKIMEEADALEDRIKEALYKNDDDRRLSGLSKTLTLTKNIFNISLSIDDYRFYKAHESDFDVSNYTKFIEKEAPLCGVTARPEDGVEKLDNYREDMSKFYECSFKRDRAFVKNIKFKGTGNRGPGTVPQVSIIVTGGFHTENLADLFKKSGIAYVSIMPNFKNCDGYECPYFNLLAGKPNPTDAKIDSFLTSTLALASFINSISELAHGDRELLRFHIKLERAKAAAQGKGVKLIYGDKELALGSSGEVVPLNTEGLIPVAVTQFLTSRQLPALAVPDKGTGNVRELLDLVDDDDNVIGTMERNETHSKGMRHRTSLVSIVNSEGKILRQKRSLTKAAGPGLYEIGMGEHVLSGEDYLATAVRGLREEQGIVVDRNDLIPLGKYRIDRHPNDREISEIYLYFLPPGTKPIPNSTEIEEGSSEFVGIDELLSDSAANADSYYSNTVIHMREQPVLLDKIKGLISERLRRAAPAAPTAPDADLIGKLYTSPTERNESTLAKDIVVQKNEQNTQLKFYWEDKNDVDSAGNAKRKPLYDKNGVLVKPLTIYRLNSIKNDAIKKELRNTYMNIGGIDGEIAQFLASMAELKDIYVIEDNPNGIRGAPSIDNHIYLVDEGVIDNVFAKIGFFHEIGESNKDFIEEILRKEGFPNLTAHTYLRGCGKDIREAYSKIVGAYKMTPVELIRALEKEAARPLTLAEKELIYYNDKYYPDKAASYREKSLIHGLQDKLFRETNNEWFSESIKRANERPFKIDSTFYYHGTSYGFEILKSGMLEGGKNPGHTTFLDTISFAEGKINLSASYAKSGHAAEIRRAKIINSAYRLYEEGHKNMICLGSTVYTAEDPRISGFTNLDTVYKIAGEISPMTLANSDEGGCRPLGVVFGFRKNKINEIGLLTDTHLNAKTFELKGELTEMSWSSEKDMVLFLSVLIRNEIEIPAVKFRIFNEEGSKVIEDRYLTEQEKENALKAAQKSANEWKPNKWEKMVADLTGKPMAVSPAESAKEMPPTGSWLKAKWWMKRAWVYETLITIFAVFFFNCATGINHPLQMPFVGAGFFWALHLLVPIIAAIFFRAPHLLSNIKSAFKWPVLVLTGATAIAFWPSVLEYSNGYSLLALAAAHFIINLFKMPKAEPAKKSTLISKWEKWEIIGIMILTMFGFAQESGMYNFFGAVGIISGIYGLRYLQERLAARSSKGVPADTISRPVESPPQVISKGLVVSSTVTEAEGKELTGAHIKYKPIDEKREAIAGADTEIADIEFRALNPNEAQRVEDAIRAIKERRKAAKDATDADAEIAQRVLARLGEGRLYVIKTPDGSFKDGIFNYWDGEFLAISEEFFKAEEFLPAEDKAEYARLILEIALFNTAAKDISISHSDLRGAGKKARLGKEEYKRGLQDRLFGEDANKTFTEFLFSRKRFYISPRNELVDGVIKMIKDDNRVNVCVGFTAKAWEPLPDNQFVGMVEGKKVYVTRKERDMAGKYKTATSQTIAAKEYFKKADRIFLDIAGPNVDRYLAVAIALGLVDKSRYGLAKALAVFSQMGSIPLGYKGEELLKMYSAAYRIIDAALKTRNQAIIEKAIHRIAEIANSGAVPAEYDKFSTNDLRIQDEQVEYASTRTIRIGDISFLDTADFKSGEDFPPISRFGGTAPDAPLLIMRFNRYKAVTAPDEQEGVKREPLGQAYSIDIRSGKWIGKDLTGLWDELNKAEAKAAKKSIKDILKTCEGWGGYSDRGGSPRDAASNLREEDVINITENYLKDVKKDGTENILSMLEAYRPQAPPKKDAGYITIKPESKPKEVINAAKELLRGGQAAILPLGRMHDFAALVEDERYDEAVLLLRKENAIPGDAFGRNVKKALQKNRQVIISSLHCLLIQRDQASKPTREALAKKSICVIFDYTGREAQKAGLEEYLFMPYGNTLYVNGPALIHSHRTGRGALARYLLDAATLRAPKIVRARRIMVPERIVDDTSEFNKSLAQSLRSAKTKNLYIKTLGAIAFLSAATILVSVLCGQRAITLFVWSFAVILDIVKTAYEVRYKLEKGDKGLKEYLKDWRGQEGTFKASFLSKEILMGFLAFSAFFRPAPEIIMIPVVAAYFTLILFDIYKTRLDTKTETRAFRAYRTIQAIGGLLFLAGLFVGLATGILDGSFDLWLGSDNPIGVSGEIISGLNALFLSTFVYGAFSEVANMRRSILRDAERDMARIAAFEKPAPAAPVVPPAGGSETPGVAAGDNKTNEEVGAYIADKIAAGMPDLNGRTPEERLRKLDALVAVDKDAYKKEDIYFIKIEGLLDNMKQFGHVGFGRTYGATVVYIDKDIANLTHEKVKKAGLDPQDVRNIIEGHELKEIDLWTKYLRLHDRRELASANVRDNIIRKDLPYFFKVKSVCHNAANESFNVDAIASTLRMACMEDGVDELTERSSADLDSKMKYFVDLTAETLNKMKLPRADHQKRPNVKISQILKESGIEPDLSRLLEDAEYIDSRLKHPAGVPSLRDMYRTLFFSIFAYDDGADNRTLFQIQDAINRTIFNPAGYHFLILHTGQNILTRIYKIRRHSYIWNIDGRKEDWSVQFMYKMADDDHDGGTSWVYPESGSVLIMADNILEDATRFADTISRITLNEPDNGLDRLLAASWEGRGGRAEIIKSIEDSITKEAILLGLKNIFDSKHMPGMDLGSLTYSGYLTILSISDSPFQTLYRLARISLERQDYKYVNYIDTILETMAERLGIVPPDTLVEQAEVIDYIASELAELYRSSVREGKENEIRNIAKDIYNEEIGIEGGPNLQQFEKIVQATDILKKSVPPEEEIMKEEIMSPSRRALRRAYLRGETPSVSATLDKDAHGQPTPPAASQVQAISADKDIILEAILKGSQHERYSAQYTNSTKYLAGKDPAFVARAFFEYLMSVAALRLDVEKAEKGYRAKLELNRLKSEELPELSVKNFVGARFVSKCPVKYRNDLLAAFEAWKWAYKMPDEKELELQFPPEIKDDRQKQFLSFLSLQGNELIIYQHTLLMMLFDANPDIAEKFLAVLEEEDCKDFASKIKMRDFFSYRRPSADIMAFSLSLQGPLGVIWSSAKGSQLNMVEEFQARWRKIILKTLMDPVVGYGWLARGILIDSSGDPLYDGEGASGEYGIPLIREIIQSLEKADSNYKKYLLLDELFCEILEQTYYGSRLPDDINKKLLPVLKEILGDKAADPLVLGEAIRIYDRLGLEGHDERFLQVVGNAIKGVEDARLRCWIALNMKRDITYYNDMEDSTDTFIKDPLVGLLDRLNKGGPKESILQEIEREYALNDRQRKLVYMILDLPAAPAAPDMAGYEIPHDVRNPWLRSVIEAGDVLRVRDNKVFAETYQKNKLPNRVVKEGVKLIEVQGKYEQVINRLNRIRAPPGAVNSVIKSINVSKLAERLSLSEDEVRDRLLRIAADVDILIVKDHIILHKEGPFAHARRGDYAVTGNRNLSKSAIWLGENLFSKYISDDEIALLMLEEAEHILAPKLNHDVIAHSAKLKAKLDGIAVEKFGEPPGKYICEADMAEEETPPATQPPTPADLSESFKISRDLAAIIRPKREETIRILTDIERLYKENKIDEAIELIEKNFPESINRIKEIYGSSPENIIKGFLEQKVGYWILSRCYGEIQRYGLVIKASLPSIAPIATKLSENELAEIERRTKILYDVAKYYPKRSPHRHVLTNTASASVFLGARTAAVIDWLGKGSEKNLQELVSHLNGGGGNFVIVKNRESTYILYEEEAARRALEANRGKLMPSGESIITDDELSRAGTPEGLKGLMLDLSRDDRIGILLGYGINNTAGFIIRKHLAGEAVKEGVIEIEEAYHNYIIYSDYLVIDFLSQPGRLEKLSPYERGYLLKMQYRGLHLLVDDIAKFSAFKGMLDGEHRERGAIDLATYDYDETSRLFGKLAAVFDHARTVWRISSAAAKADQQMKMAAIFKEILANKNPEDIIKAMGDWVIPLLNSNLYQSDVIRAILKAIEDNYPPKALERARLESALRAVLGINGLGDIPAAQLNVVVQFVKTDQRTMAQAQTGNAGRELSKPGGNYNELMSQSIIGEDVIKVKDMLKIINSARKAMDESKDPVGARALIYLPKNLRPLFVAVAFKLGVAEIKSGEFRLTDTRMRVQLIDQGDRPDVMTQFVLGIEMLDFVRDCEASVRKNEKLPEPKQGLKNLLAAVADGQDPEVILDNLFKGRFYLLEARKIDWDKRDDERRAMEAVVKSL